MAKWPVYYTTPLFLVSTAGLSGKCSEQMAKWTFVLVCSDMLEHVAFGVKKKKRHPLDYF